MRRPDVNARDVHFYGGLLLAAAAGWFLSPVLTGVALGLILAAVGYFTPQNGKP